jgi:phosphatidylglycerophosphatase A
LPTANRSASIAFQRFIVLTATGGGVGYSPVAPGTLGSLIAIPIWLVFATLVGHLPELVAIPLTIAFVGAVVVLACWVAGEAETLLGEHDSGKIVIDEVAGMLVGLSFHSPDLIAAATVFVLFRFFDIVKPWPAGDLDARLKGGTGVVFDDLAAGVYANLLARILV